MKYLTYLAVSAFMFTCLSCGNEKSVNESETTGTTLPVVPANTTTQPQTVPVNINSQTTPSTTVTPASTTPATTTVAPGMNPAHGQPGHRCDIAVGAPLNSAPATTATTPATTAVPTPINISPNKLTPPATTTVAPGMNPAHGQPGHRCDIAVGAPLNSAPATTTTTPVTTTSSDKLTPPATTVVAPGMNPAHGQPGHRCDIAVGAPLNSAPTQQPATTTTTPVPTPINIPADKLTQPATTAVAPGMNPAHGQPGHRCDIAVGEPLSTPIKSNYTPPAATKEIIPKAVPIKNR